MNHSFGELGKKKRLFLAFNLPEFVKTELSKILKRLEETNRHVRWVAPENLHLTLHFLGDLDFAAEQKLITALNDINFNFHAFEFELGKISCFPDPASPRVIYIVCRQTNGDGARELQENLSKILIEQGIDIDRRVWKPHLTLGRLKESRIGENLDLSEARIPDLKLRIGSFELMESKLTRSSSVYGSVASFKL